MEEEEFVDYVKTLHEQNLNGREDFLQAFEKGIRAAYEELQQPEVEIESATIAKLWNAKHCDEIRDILKEFSNSILNQHEYNLSTLTQDKVREAAESAFNQARKQTSMLGEKDVQMTDYLISPKYKTFDDYWNSKKH